RVAIGFGKVRRGAVAEPPPALVEQQDRGQELAAGGGFDLAEIFVEDRFRIAATARLAFEAAVELVERAEQLRRKLHHRLPEIGAAGAGLGRRLSHCPSDKSSIRHCFLRALKCRYGCVRGSIQSVRGCDKSFPQGLETAKASSESCF